MSYPSSIDDLSTTRGTSGAPLSNPNHITHHTAEDTAIQALETKVGVNSSADATSIDYKLKNPASIDPGHKHTNSSVTLALDDLSDVVITSPADGNGLAYEAASGKFKNISTTTADASASVKGVTKLSVAPVSSTAPIAVGDNDPRFTTNSGTALNGTSNKVEDAGDTSATSVASKLVRADASGLIDKSFLKPGIQTTFTAGMSITPGQPFCVSTYSSSQVALDTSTNDTGTGSTITKSFTVGANSNRGLVLFLLTSGTSATSVTYNGVALTKIDSSGVTGATNFLETWYLSAPATGANNLVINFSGSRTAYWNIYSYYNVSQSGQPEVNSTGIGSSGSSSVSVTPLTNGALIAGAGYLAGATASGSIFTNNKITNAANTNLFSSDSGGIFPQSSQTLSTSGGSGNVAVNVLVLAPVATSLTPRAYLTSAVQSTTTVAFAGISQSTVSAGQTMTGIVAGIDANQSGLTIGAQYYLGNTPGTFSTSAGSVSRKAGIALSATSILITNIW